MAMLDLMYRTTNQSLNIDVYVVTFMYETFTPIEATYLEIFVDDTRSTIIII
jgi:hypothetical protein